MIPYHGGPMNPDTCAIRLWKNRHAFVSFARHHQLPMVSKICRSFALDNGAFSIWQKAIKNGLSTNVDWVDFYMFVSRWMNHPRFDFAVVPDVIAGSEHDNDMLAAGWPFPKHMGAVVWHTNESTERLVHLAKTWPRVAIGSSGEYDASSPKKLVRRMLEVLPAICDENGFPICKLHGLRMLNPAVFSMLPLASADSTNVARNIKIDKAWRGTYLPASLEARTMVMVERIEQDNSACRVMPIPGKVQSN